MRKLMFILSAVVLTSATVHAVDDDIHGEVNLDRASTVIEEIKLNIAAVTWNEGSVRASRAEARAIFQTQWHLAGGVDATPAEVLRAQRRLSKRVTGVRPAREIGNERWSRNLRWNDLEPDGWEVTGLPWAHHATRWATMREVISDWVDQHFDGHPVRQCKGTPFGWGGPRVDESRLTQRNAARAARGRGPLLVLDCGNTVNGFFGIPNRGSRTRRTLSVRLVHSEAN